MLVDERNLDLFYSMKCHHQIDIRLPRECVLRTINNAELYPKWQRGLISTELIKGESGQTGAKRRIYIKIAGQRIQMIETILEYQPPERWQARYTANGLKSIQTNIFKAISNDVTRWDCYSEFQFSGSMVLISKLMPQVFRERARLTQTDFRTFAEELYG